MRRNKSLLETSYSWQLFLWDVFRHPIDPETKHESVLNAEVQTKNFCCNSRVWRNDTASASLHMYMKLPLWYIMFLNSLRSSRGASTVIFRLNYMSTLACSLGQCSSECLKTSFCYLTVQMFTLLTRIFASLFAKTTNVIPEIELRVSHCNLFYFALPAVLCWVSLLIPCW